MFLDPNYPSVIEQARKDGISDNWIEAAQNSPVYKLAIEYKLAFPLHPEYRTLPMVWYVPPLSPIMSHFEGKDSIQNPDLIFPAIEEMRTPVQYLANILTAGDTKTVKEALQRMAMMRQYMRAKFSKNGFAPEKLARVNLNAQQMEEMYRLLAIAKYEDRFVVPTSRKEGYMDPYRAQGMEGFGLDCDGCTPSFPSETTKSGKQLYEENFYGGIWRD